MTVVNDSTGKSEALRVDDDGHLLVSGAFGAGGATAAKQDTGNVSLASIDTKVSTAAKQDTGNTSLAAIDAKTPTRVDSLGAALPLDFDYLAVSYGYTGDNLTTIVKTKGANTYTKTLTYVGANLTAESEWVTA